MTLKLQGTFRAAGRRSAVINGQRVAVGDRVSGAQVVEIGKDRVVVEVDGETVELARNIPMIKAPVDIRKTADSRGAGPWQGLAE
jgi:flagellar biogenesis protein FliO